MAGEDPAAPYLPAAREALACFPVNAARIRTAAVSENVSFRVSTDRGEDYVLRLHRPGYNSLDELESERLWRDALADAGLEVQRALPARDGRHFIAVPLNAEQSADPATSEPGAGRYASMVSWLPGEVLGHGLLARADSTRRRRYFRDLGALAARIHNQAAGWITPPGFTRPRLDIDGLLGEQPRWGRFWDHCALSERDRSLLLDAREKLVSMLADYGMRTDNFSLTHADLHPENVLVDPEGQLGVIDFDDCAFGWHGYDLASALIEEHDAADAYALQEALLAGYREHRAFSAEDEAMLPTFLLLRGMALIGWVHERPEHGEDEYFLGIREMVLRRCRELVGGEAGPAPGGQVDLYDP